MGVYSREVAFYRDIAARVPVRAPQSYYAAVSDDGRRFCLLLEDLTPAAECGQIEGCGVDRARTALGQAAALHAGILERPGSARLRLAGRRAGDLAQGGRRRRAGPEGVPHRVPEPECSL
jgi:hypothetical protein